MTEASIVKLLEELRNSGVQLAVDDAGDLKVTAPAGTMEARWLCELRTRKRQIVELLQRMQNADALPSLPERGAGRTDGEVLTPMQRSLWLTCQIEVNTDAYNMLSTVEIRGEFDATLLRTCIERVHRRHGSLRTRFVAVNGEPRQIVDADAELDCAIVDVDEQGLADAMAKEAARVFDLACGPLFVARIFRLANRHHVFVFNTHHIVFDGWSRGVILRELGELYRARGADVLPPLPFDYVDFSRWYAEEQESRSDQQARSFWNRWLEGALATLDVPTDFPRPARMTSSGASVPVQITARTTEAAHSFAHRHEVTLHQLLLTVFQVMLFRYSGQRDLVVGVPSANRNFVEVESLVGYFVNPLPVRQLMDAQQSFSALLADNKRRLTGMTVHQDYPFEKIVDSHNPERNLSHAPVFQHMFSFHAAGEVLLDLPGAQVGFLQAEERSAKYDILFAIHDHPGGLRGSIQFNTSLYEAESMCRLAANFEVLLQCACEDATRPVGDLTLLNPSEKEFIVSRLGNVSAPFQNGLRSIQDRFEQQTKTQPSAVALRCGDQILSYSQLDSRSDAIAAHLQTNGVVVGDLVGLCLPRTPDLVAGLIAILKLGAAYVPLDPKYPKLRLQEIAREAHLLYVLCDATSCGLIAGDDIRELRVEAVPACSVRPEPAARDANQLAYVIFTSGSTGRPKGVMVTHKNALALLDWVYSTYRDDELAAVLASTSVCFDISVFEIWAPLGVGGTIMLAEDATELCRRSFDDLSLINTVPSALRLLVEEGALPRSLKVVNVAGEPLDKLLVNDLFKCFPGVLLYNLYGPTEDTTYSTYCRLASPVAADPPIGRPIANSYGRVLDERGEMVPVGAVGELYLGGAGVSRGYLHRPDLTAERFMRHCDGDGLERTEYRTGDLVRLRNDGELHYVGRADRQVKLRGFRIELGEIEHALRRIKGVADACVLLKKQQSCDVLAAYVVRTCADEAQDANLLATTEQQLRAGLPDYMVPAAFVLLDRLPLNNSGKIDQCALLERDVAVAAQGVPVGARNSVERTIVEIWKNLLQRDQIGIHDDFFKLGGNSLLAMQMISRVNKAFGNGLTFSVAFECKTVALLAARLEAGDARPALPLERLGISGQVIASYPQQGAWSIANLDLFKTFYNMVNAMWLEGPLDVDALQRSLDRLIARHESLRAYFALVDNALMMCITPYAEVPLQRFDLDVVGDDKARAFAQAEIEREYAREFNLLAGPLIRTSLLRRSQTQHLFILTIHHLVTDAWSNNLIKKELAAYYADEIGIATTLPEELPIHYTDYAYWYARWHETEPYRRQIDYWHRKLATMAATELIFKTDTGAGVHTPGTMSYVEVYISKERYAAIVAFARGRTITPYIVFMAALHLSLSAYWGIEEYMVYSPVAGRLRQELEASVGLYVNMVIVISRIVKTSTVDEFVRQIGDNVLEAHANSDVSMMAMMQKLKAPLPAMPSVVLNVIDLPDTADWALSALTASTFELECDGKLGLTGLNVIVHVHPNEVNMRLGYNTALFHPPTGRRLAALFSEAIDVIVDSPASGVESWLAARRG